MNFKLISYHLIIALFYMSLFKATISKARAGETEDFVARVKEHYQKTLPINAFSMKYHFLNRRYQDHNYWDYKTPNLYMSQRVVEVDMEKKHFYDNDVVYFAGGRLYDRTQFQNDKESFFYERSATFLGKAILRQDLDSFDRFMSHIVMNIDFLAVRPLLEEVKIKKHVTLKKSKHSNTATLTHTTSDGDTVAYKFRNDPLQLVSINHSSLNGIFVYKDYQTSRDITYARKVYQYYDGETKPTYIKFNDHFDIIDEVDPTRLQVPQGYGPELQEGDGILVSKEIAKNLYLVTDSSAVHNSLLKVNGDEISIFGATGTSEIAEKTIELIREQFPEKKMSSVYVSHPHGHQIAGLKVFADQGVEIMADEYSIAGIKAYPNFTKDISKFKFRVIEHEQVIDGGQFYVLENMHSKRQSFVYFRESGIIFQSHFLHVPLDNTIAKVIPNYTRTFIDFIRSKNLKVNRVVGNYVNNNISVEVMNKIYDVNI